MPKLRQKKQSMATGGNPGVEDIEEKKNHSAINQGKNRATGERRKEKRTSEGTPKRS